MNKNKFVLSVLATCCLSACMPAIRDLPENTQVVAPQSWRVLPENAVAANISPSWWQVFGDPVLTELVARAEANNTDIATSLARVDQARAQVMQAQSLLFPNIHADVAGKRERKLSPLGQPSYSSTGDPGFVASYEIDIWGKNIDKRAAAERSMAAMQAASEAARVSVISATVQTYITLRALDANLQVLQKTLKAREQSLQRVRSRVQAGYSPQLELDQARVQYAATAQQIPAIQKNISETENALSVLVGEAPQSIPRGLAFEDLLIPATPESLPSSLLYSRPDIAQAEYLLAAADKTLSASRKEFLPSINITASVSRLWNSNLIDDPYNLWSVGGSILAPLFTGGQLTGQFEGAQARRLQAAIAYKDTVLNAFKEVEDKLSAVHYLRLQDEQQQHQFKATADQLHHAERRYHAGYTDYFEVVDAQRGHLAIQSSIIQTRAERLNAAVALYQALGGGWQTGQHYAGKVTPTTATVPAAPSTVPTLPTTR
ncbi:efflux transporter outer membrane subunit [Brackiella oedipodis]|uniref:efflux transporter outer membrane subunit n=1 Tax=Brackiella oedipodis TaxID=124225 RepID=UPI0009FCBB74|nr:efflux transporter outer membrane subunit [Brackiella oedipodis]